MDFYLNSLYPLYLLFLLGLLSASNMLSLLVFKRTNELY